MVTRYGALGREPGETKKWENCLSWHNKSHLAQSYLARWP